MSDKDYRALADRELQRRLNEFAEKLGVSMEAEYVSELEAQPTSHFLYIPRLADKDRTAPDDEQAGVHSGHRERLRASVRSDPRLDGFSDVEILEILLSFLVPQRDTNVIAHKLLDEFGSLADAVNAGQERLFAVCGMTQGAATLLPGLWRVCSGENSLDVTICTRYDALNFFGSMYLGGAAGGMCIAYIDGNNRLIALEHASSVTDISYRFAVGSAIKYGANGVLPVWFGRETIGIGCDAVAYASNLARVLDTSGVMLFDFIMLTDYGYYTPGTRKKNYGGWIPQYVFMPERNFVRSMRVFEAAHSPDGDAAPEPISSRRLSEYIISLRGGE